ncbi:MAG: nucleotide exchange factor GrpE, partial [bacterium]|nr:nucleotide exchange factor GrpE [bacterium]
MNEENQTVENSEIVDSLPQEDAPVSDAHSDSSAERIAALEAELATAKQDILYAHADTQNVRRRLEKELADARAYSTTNFARDMLSVADNLTRALAAIPVDLREDDKFKGLVVGLDATGRELEAVFGRNGVSKMVSVGEPLDPNKH